MRWSLKIGSVSGIGIYVHWTFVLLIAWVFWANYSPQTGLAQALEAVALVVAIFGCVVLHELGHSLTALRYGIRTRDITLLPIGGVASLERIPENPKQELWITINGPLVNLIIAGALYIGLSATGALGEEVRRLSEAMENLQPGDQPPRPSFLFSLMAINLFLVLFNLLPAFPMDGGRILRATLAFFLDYPTATRIAARVGQLMAILFATAGLFWNPFLLLIALFVFLGAEAESQAAAMRAAFRGLQVRDGMMTRFRVLHPDDTLRHAADELLAGSQQDFPVVTNGEGGPAQVVGMLPRAALLRALAAGGLEAPVAQAMVRDCPVVQEHEPIELVYQRMRENGCAALPVVRQGELVGLLSLENVSEMVMIRSALEGSAERAVTG